MTSSITSRFLASVPPYRSSKFIQINDYRLGLLDIMIKLLIVGYIVGYTIIYKHGYQEVDLVNGVVNVKIKGSASDGNYTNPATVFDSYDLIQPALENNAFFVTTRLYITKNQTKGIWSGNSPSELPDKITGLCEIGKYTDNGQIRSSIPDPDTGYCLINAWGPIEPYNIEPSNCSIMADIEDWTVYIRATAYTFDSAFSTATPTDVNQGKPLAGINLFSMEDILEKTGFIMDDVRINGAIILGQLEYDCNLDSSTTECWPKIKWTRLDVVGSEGFNYRYADRSVGIQSGRTVRTLYKAWGIRVMFTISGNGRRASPIPLFTAIGAGIGLLAVSSVVCDLILQYFMANRDRYNEEKFQMVNESDFSNGGSGNGNSNEQIAADEIANITAMANGAYTTLPVDDLNRVNWTKNPANRKDSNSNYMPPNSVKLREQTR